MIQSSLVLDIIHSTHVPSIPDVLSHILKLAEDPNASIKDLEEVVLREPGLVTQLLKVVNSAFYAMARPVSSVRYAMTMLGFSTVRSVATGLILIDTFNQMDDINQDYVNQIWQSSLISANIMNVFTKTHARESADSLFLSAMVKDVGYILLSQHFQSKFDELIKDDLYPPASVQKKILGVDHIEISCALLEEWRFSKDVIEIVRSQNTDMDNSQGHQLLQLCDCFSRYEDDYTHFFDQTQDDLDDDVLKYMDAAGMSWQQILENQERIYKAIESVQQLLHG